MSEIQVYHVYCQLREVSNEWNAIGRELGISLNDREEMKKKSELSDDRLEMVLDKWKKSECCEVSWDKIIDMLLNLKLKNVASEVRRYLLEDKEAVRIYAWKEGNLLTDTYTAPMILAPLLSQVRKYWK